MEWKLTENELPSRFYEKLIREGTIVLAPYYMPLTSTPTIGNFGNPAQTVNPEYYYEDTTIWSSKKIHTIRPCTLNEGGHSDVSET